MKKLSMFLSLAIAATVLSGCYVSPYAYHRGGCPPELPPLKVDLSPLKVDMLPVQVEVEKKKKTECPTCDPCRPACPY